MACDVGFRMHGAVVAWCTVMSSPGKAATRQVHGRLTATDSSVDWTGQTVTGQRGQVSGWKPTLIRPPGQRITGRLMTLGWASISACALTASCTLAWVAAWLTHRLVLAWSGS